MTFKTQAETFLAQIQSRRRNPVKPSTIASYQSRLNAHILPIFGHLNLSQVENGTMKTFVAKLSKQGLSASSINGLVSVVKEVVSSAVDANGNQLYPRTWNSEFMDLPVVNPRAQHAPVATPKTIQHAIGRANGQEKALYALLAGTGLRIGEALALRVGPDDGLNSFWQPETGILIIRKALDIMTGKDQSPKTEAGIREVDLAPNLNTFLCERLLDSELPGHGLLFQNTAGGPVRFNTLREHAVEAGIDSRFHSFRRFRVTHLRKMGTPDGLVQFWAGHAGKSITDRYDKIGFDKEARKEWASKVGLGFQLEA